MPSSLRARSSTAASPDLRSSTSAATSPLRWRRPMLSRAWCSTCVDKACTWPAPPCPNHSLYCSHASNTDNSTISARITRDVPPTRIAASAPQRHEGVATRVTRGAAELFFDAQQLVVLGHAIGAAQRTGLDLRGGGGHRDVGDRRVLGFARAVRNDGGIARLVGHRDRFQGFGQRADLVDLDQDRVGHALFDAFLEDARIGDEQIVADQLHLFAQTLGEL